MPYFSCGGGGVSNVFVERGAKFLSVLIGDVAPSAIRSVFQARGRRRPRFSSTAWPTSWRTTSSTLVVLEFLGTNRDMVCFLRGAPAEDASGVSYSVVALDW